MGNARVGTRKTNNKELRISATQEPAPSRTSQKTIFVKDQARKLVLAPPKDRQFFHSSFRPHKARPLERRAPSSQRMHNMLSKCRDRSCQRRNRRPRRAATFLLSSKGGRIRTRGPQRLAHSSKSSWSPGCANSVIS